MSIFTGGLSFFCPVFGLVRSGFAWYFKEMGAAPFLFLHIHVFTRDPPGKHP
jgi:hypothetical protein